MTLEEQLWKLAHEWLAAGAKDWLDHEGAGPSAFRCAHDLLDLLEHVEEHDQEDKTDQTGQGPAMCARAVRRGRNVWVCYRDKDHPGDCAD